MESKKVISESILNECDTTPMPTEVIEKVKALFDEAGSTKTKPMKS